MFFLLRAAFWLCFVSFLLPAGGDQTAAPRDEARKAVETVRAVSAPPERTSSACARDLETCAPGSSGWLGSLHRIQQGAAGLYRSVMDRVAPRDPSQGTLRSSDLEPDWRRPARPKPL